MGFTPIHLLRRDLVDDLPVLSASTEKIAWGAAVSTRPGAGKVPPPLSPSVSRSPSTPPGQAIPRWFNPTDEVIQDMLPGLRLLCCIQRSPSRGQHCPGIGAAWKQCWTREKRPSDQWTNVDFMVDFLQPGDGLPDDFEYAVGSIARACMPGNADPANWHESATRAYITKLDSLDWTTAEARQAQFEAWRGPALRCTMRCGADNLLVLEVLTVICFAPLVADTKLDFPELAMEVSTRYQQLLRRRRGAVAELDY